MERLLRNRRLAWCLVLAASLLCVGTAAVELAAQGIMRKPLAVAVEEGADEQKTGDDADSKFPGGPGLKTDPEAQQLLARAELFVDDERYDLASVLWQKVLDDSGDSLVSVDGRLYISLRRQVEQRLADLPKIALATYRIRADGEAQALLSAAEPDKEEDALTQVVRRFFMSSVGDDAAYRLGCLALDRYDFVGASRMFSKVLEEHPDPSIPRTDLLLRLAVAAGRVGDRDGANKYLSELEAASGPRPSRVLLAQVNDDIKQNGASTQLVSARLTMPAIPADATAKTLTEFWSHEYPMVFMEQMMNQNIYVGGRGMAPRGEKQQISRDQVIERWKQNGWRPAGKLLIHEGRVYFKTNNEVTCWSTEGDEKPIWKSAWFNEFEIDDFTGMQMMMAVNMGLQPGAQQDNRPRTPAEVLLFGDQIHQDMSLVGDLLLNVEGRRTPKHGPGDTVTRAPKQFNWNSIPRRSRTNWLAAYDARNGKAKWHRAADDEAKDGEGGMGFMSAPVACGGVLLAPVTDGGTMWLYGMSPEDGRTLFKTYLCDEPVGGANAWSPMKVAVEGRDAYVLCGSGVVFALDGTSGSIRWVLRYERDEKQGVVVPGRNAYGRPNTLKAYDGWSEDAIVPMGRHLVVMASDSNWMNAFDCRTGDLLWRSPRRKEGTGEEVDYYIGSKGRGIFVGGKAQLRRVDVISGKIAWEYPSAKPGEPPPPTMDSYGRAVLTDDAIYVPVDDSVVTLDPETGEEKEQVGVRITSNDPVGNLYTDGEKLWVLSANRFYSLTHLEYRMKSLEKRVQNGDSAALLERMRLLAKSEQWDDAMNDMRTAYKQLRSMKGHSEAAAAIFEVLDELKLYPLAPSVLLGALTELLAPDLESLSPAMKVKVQSACSQILASLPKEKTPGVAAVIISAAPLYQEDFLHTAARSALKVVVAADDKEALAAAVKEGQGPIPLIAAEAWAMADAEAAKEVLTERLASSEGQSKLLYSRALLQTGDRSALEPLIGLLSSGDLTTRIRSFETLRAATKKNDLPFTPYAGEDERTTQIAAWKDWYVASADSLELVLPLPDTGTLLGRTLVCYHSRNQVLELDSEGKEISRRTIAQPWTAQGLPNGNRLIASTSQGRLVEYDDEWKEVWVVDGLPAGIWSVDRTLDGKTIVTCADMSQVLEITPDKEKKVIWRGDRTGGRPVFARRLANGNTLVCVQGLHKVVEVDPSGKEVWEATNIVNPYAAQRLEDGTTLIAAMMNGRNGALYEYDSAGQQKRAVKQNVMQLYSADRLPNGNILYADSQGLHEIDSEGKTIGTIRREAGITGFSRF
jgi:outer membrane protein assembly factor BamB